MADPTILNPITKITQKVNGEEFEAPIGVENWENVRTVIGKDENQKYITLQQFYENFNNFKDNGKFIWWDTKGPNENPETDPSLKIWYNTEW